ncbi:hypothetical protein, partial [Sphingobium scionense]
LSACQLWLPDPNPIPILPWIDGSYTTSWDTTPLSRSRSRKEPFRIVPSPAEKQPGEPRQATLSRVLHIFAVAQTASADAREGGRFDLCMTITKALLVDAEPGKKKADQKTGR